MRPPSTLLQLNAILVLFCAAAMLFTNVADGQQDTLGLGGLPIPADKGEIDLPSGTKLIKDKEEFKKYQHNDKTFEPCNVEFNTDGNIEVFYDDKLASTKGCTVDLLFDKMDQIKFVAKVEDKEKNCVTNDFKHNLLPFIFNEANNGLTTLTNGPIAGDEKDCADKRGCGKGKCIKRTIFEIGWKRNNQIIEGYLFQIGELSDGSWLTLDEAKMDVEMAVGDVSDKAPLVTITGGGKSSQFPGGAGNPVCNNPRKATPPPAIWKVKSGEFKGKYFVTFHFFPQKSAGTGGPKCKGPKQPSFVFLKDFAPGLLAIPKPQPTTTKTTIGSTKATEIESTTPEIKSTTPEIESTTPEIKLTTPEIKSTTTEIQSTTSRNELTTPNGTTSSTPPPTPETTEPTGGLSTAAIVGIVAGSVLVVAIIVAVVVYFLCCRNGKDAANSEDDEYLEDAEEKDAENAGGNDSANS